ncbi:MAG: dCTP deaminase [Nanoarchaeota archaeon]|nr:dCTP deaminase [Nanoarchaeota archaeon]
MLLTDKEIRKFAEAGMIDPFVDKQVREVEGNKVVSYGLSGNGYDMRIANEFKVFELGTSNLSHYFTSPAVDPKNFNESLCKDYNGNICIIPPNSFVLGRSMEKFKIPRNIMCLVVGKSTYARCGIIVNVTPLESEWEGHVTIEISNTSSIPAKIYSNEGIAQVIFFENRGCEVSYKDKGGKYQGQGEEVVYAKV